MESADRSSCSAKDSKTLTKAKVNKKGASFSESNEDTSVSCEAAQSALPRCDASGAQKRDKEPSPLASPADAAELPSPSEQQRQMPCVELPVGGGHRNGLQPRCTTCARVEKKLVLKQEELMQQDVRHRQEMEILEARHGKELAEQKTKTEEAVRKAEEEASREIERRLDRASQDHKNELDRLKLKYAGEKKAMVDLLTQQKKNVEDDCNTLREEKTVLEKRAAKERANLEKEGKEKVDRLHEELLKEKNDALKEKEAEHRRNADHLRKVMEDADREKTATHEAEIVVLKEKHSAALRDERAMHKDKMNSRQREHEGEMRSQREEHQQVKHEKEATITDLKEKLRKAEVQNNLLEVEKAKGKEEQERQIKEHHRNVDRIRQEHSEEASGMRQKFENILDEKDQQLTTERVHSQELQTKCDFLQGELDKADSKREEDLRRMQEEAQESERVLTSGFEKQRKIWLEKYVTDEIVEEERQRLVKQRERLEEQAAEDKKRLDEETTRLQKRMADKEKRLQEEVAAEKTRLQQKTAKERKDMEHEMERLKGELAKDKKGLEKEKTRLQDEITRDRKAMEREKNRLKEEVANQRKDLDKEKERLKRETAQEKERWKQEERRLQSRADRLNRTCSLLTKQRQATKPKSRFFWPSMKSYKFQWNGHANNVRLYSDWTLWKPEQMVPSADRRVHTLQFDIPEGTTLTFFFEVDGERQVRHNMTLSRADEYGMVFNEVEVK